MDADPLTTRIRVLAILALLALAGAMALAYARDADAHANLAEADPAPNSVLDEPPERVSIRFTEPLEAALSHIHVLDSSGRRVDLDDSALDPADPTTMSVSLPPLEDGAYTVAWKNVSTVDGHLVRGAFAFSVGQPLSEDAAVAEEHPLFRAWPEPYIRWMTLTGLAVMVGGLFFHVAAARPALYQTSDPQTRTRIFRASLEIAIYGVGLFFLGSVAHLVLQASLVYETSILSTLPGPVTDLARDTAWGRLWIARAFPALAIAALLFYMMLTGERRFLVEICAALGAVALLLTSMTSHAAAIPDIAAASLLNDFIHLTAASIWVGGVFGIAFTIMARPGREALLALLGRFSPVAAFSVVALGLTGIYSAWAQVYIPQAMATPYGITLAVKTLLVVVLLALGFGNLTWSRRGRRGDERAQRWIPRLVTAEIAVMLLVMLSVGFLTTLEPARQAAARQGIGAEDALTFADTSEGAQITLSVEPGQVGPNTLSLSLQDRFGEPITNATDVRARLSYLDADLGEPELSAIPNGDGEFVLEDQLIGIAGAWQVEIAVTRPDAFDARTAFRFETSGAGGAASLVPSRATAYVLLGIISAVLGLIFLAASVPLGGFRTREGIATMPLGVVGVLGAAALVSAALGAADDVPARNPIPPTSESVRMGQTLYAGNCLTCHGESGLGDGPAAVGLQPPPANLVIHVPLHPDRAIFEFIADGVPGTAMAGQRDTLSDDDIWHIINYIRTLE